MRDERALHEQVKDLEAEVERLTGVTQSLRQELEQKVRTILDLQLDLHQQFVDDIDEARQRLRNQIGN
jgi:archaellum component FlaC